MAKSTSAIAAPDFELAGNRRADLQALRPPRQLGRSSPSTRATPRPSARASSAPTATRPTGSTRSTPRCSGSRRSRSTRTSASPPSTSLNVPLLADPDHATARAYGMRRARAGWCAGRSSSSTPKGWSATATSPCSGSATRTSSDLERRCRSRSAPLRDARAGPVRRRSARPALARRDDGGGAADRRSATGSPRPAATSSTARGRWRARGYRMITYDARGHGESDPAPAGEGYGYPELAGDLERSSPSRSGERRSCSRATRWAPTRWPRTRSRDPERLAGLVVDRAGLLGGPIAAESLAYWDGLADGARERRGRRVRRRHMTSGLDPALARDGAADHPRPARPPSPPRGGGAGAARGAALAARSRPRASSSSSTSRRWSSPATTTPIPAIPTRSPRPRPSALPRAQLISEEPGESPLAWQGGRLSREIAAFCERAARSPSASTPERDSAPGRSRSRWTRRRPDQVASIAQTLLSTSPASGRPRGPRPRSGRWRRPRRASATRPRARRRVDGLAEAAEAPLELRPPGQEDDDDVERGGRTALHGDRLGSGPSAAGNSGGAPGKATVLPSLIRACVAAGRRIQWSMSVVCSSAPTRYGRRTCPAGRPGVGSRRPSRRAPNRLTGRGTTRHVSGSRRNSAEGGFTCRAEFATTSGRTWSGYVAVFIALSGTAFADRRPLPGVDQVGSQDIINQEVQTADLDPGSVTTGKIASGGVTAPDLAGDVISDDTLNPLTGSTKVASGAIKESELGASSVFGAEVAPGSLDGSDIADGSLQGGDLADGSIGAADLGTGSVGTAEVAATRSPETTSTSRRSAVSTATMPSTRLRSVRRGLHRLRQPRRSRPGTRCRS